jgi:hypothetical protein
MGPLSQVGHTSQRAVRTPQNLSPFFQSAHSRICARVWAFSSPENRKNYWQASGVSRSREDAHRSTWGGKSSARFHAASLKRPMTTMVGINTAAVTNATPAKEPRSRGVLDTRMRGYDSVRPHRPRHCLRQTRSVCARERQRRPVRRSSKSVGGSNPHFPCCTMDCFASLAMTALAASQPRNFEIPGSMLPHRPGMT